MINLLAILLGIPAIMVATTIHEFTRAAVSTALGDKIPKEEGRLTLNPIKHFEPIGLIIMLACGFGWGKPVNTSSLYYKNRKLSKDENGNLCEISTPGYIVILPEIILADGTKVIPDQTVRNNTQTDELVAHSR